jgi:hypothetical protein
MHLSSELKPYPLNRGASGSVLVDPLSETEDKTLSRYEFVLLARGIRMELLWSIFSLDTANAIPFQIGSKRIPSQWLR